MNHSPTQSRDTSNDSSMKYLKVSSFWNCGNCARPKTFHRRYTGDILPVTAGKPQVWQWPNPRKVVQKRNMASLSAKGWASFKLLVLPHGIHMHYIRFGWTESRAVGTVSWFFTHIEHILSSACRKFWKWWINNRNWSNGMTEGFSINDPGHGVRWDGQPLDEAFWPWFVVRSWGMVSL